MANFYLRPQSPRGRREPSRGILVVYYSKNTVNDGPVSEPTLKTPKDNQERKDSQDKYVFTCNLDTHTTYKQTPPVQNTLQGRLAPLCEVQQKSGLT
jgi:hypothetical protein